MKISTHELPLTVTVTDRASMDSQLDTAVNNVRVAAREQRRGILVTRHSATQFTIELSDSVPFGVTHEHQAW